MTNFKSEICDLKFWDGFFSAPPPRSPRLRGEPKSLRARHRRKGKRMKDALTPFILRGLADRFS